MNPANPLLTVILPTHNRAGFLRETIESVLSQTFTGFELIVVDDGSTDRTGDVVKKFPKIHYIRCPINSGVSKARNIGVEQARGQYISFIDSDDLWVETKLKT